MLTNKDGVNNGVCRNLLPVSLLFEFQEWLIAKGFEVVETNAPYANYGVRVNGSIYLVYTRADTHAGKDTVHASIYGPVERLARQFLLDRRHNTPQQLAVVAQSNFPATPLALSKEIAEKLKSSNGLKGHLDN